MTDIFSVINWNLSAAPTGNTHAHWVVNPLPCDARFVTAQINWNLVNGHREERSDAPQGGLSWPAANSPPDDPLNRRTAPATLGDCHAGERRLAMTGYFCLFVIQ